MRAVHTVGLIAASMAMSPSAFASSGTLADLASGISGVTQVLAALGTLLLLYVIRSKQPRVIKLDAEGRRYDPTVRGLFED